VSAHVRLGAALLASGVALLLAPIAATAASADPIGNCTTTTGTIIAVDFAHWGGPVVRGCGVAPSNGYTLLHAAGFTTAGDAHDGPGYICRIGNQAFASGTQYPTPAQDACIVTPPPSAYWSYWSAPAGRNTWSYSRVGALGAHPQPGEVDLWVFGGTDVGGTTGSAVPGISPDSVRAHNLSPTGGPHPGGTLTTGAPAPPAPPNSRASVAPQANGSQPATVAPGASSGGSSDGSGSGPAPDSTRPASTRTSTPTTLSAHAQPTGSAIPEGPSGSATVAPRFVDALPAVHTNGSTGSFVPLLIGGALVLVLGGATAGALWRRRQPE
jgi:hypothetical protein